MNKLAIYPWQTAYVSAVLEFDPNKISIKVREAVRVIHERMKKPITLGGQEYRAIQDARTGIAMLTAEIDKKSFN
jgi:hypothetical protein